MRKIYLILIILTACMTISCNNSSSGDSQTGYKDPGLTPKDVSADKSYDLTGTGGPSDSGINCRAVVYIGTYNNAPYAGIAVDDDATGFKLKIHWELTDTIDTSSTDPVVIGPIDPSKYTIKATISGTEYASTPEEPKTSNSLKITIKPNTPSDKIYTIEFNDIIDVDGKSIIDTNSKIQAYKYP